MGQEPFPTINKGIIQLYLLSHELAASSTSLPWPAYVLKYNPLDGFHNLILLSEPQVRQ